MSAVTVTSDQARINWRDTIDQAYRDGEVVIERYGKPMVVVVNFERWQQMRQLWLDMLTQRSAEVKAGDFVDFADVERELAAA